MRQDLICYRAVRGQQLVICLVGWKFIVSQGWILGLSLVQYLLVLESHLSEGTFLTLGLIHQPANLVESQQTGFLFLPSFLFSGEVYFSAALQETFQKVPRQSLFLKPETIFTVGFSMVGEQKSTAPEFSLKYHVGQSGS